MGKPESSEHRPGFYASVQLGGGYAFFGSDFAGEKMSVSGAGIGGSILCGGMLRNNLALVGDLRVLSVSNPTVKLGDVSAEAKDTSIVMTAVGPGVIYYVMPANVLLGASVLMSRLSWTQDDETMAQTDLGIGGALRIGKEWALRRGGLGVLGDFSFGSMKDKDGGPRWSGTALMLSAAYTYN